MHNNTCAFDDCGPATMPTCPMVGGCITARYGRQVTRLAHTDVNDKLRALNGTLPARTNRDPTWIKRPRKAIQP